MTATAVPGAPVKYTPYQQERLNFISSITGNEATASLLRFAIEKFGISPNNAPVFVWDRIERFYYAEGEWRYDAKG